MDIRLLEGAKEDLRNGWFFYEPQTTGLGDRFLNAIEADVRLLPAYAGIHLQVDGFHRILIKRFPFALYYLIEEGDLDRHLCNPGLPSGSQLDPREVDFSVSARIRQISSTLARATQFRYAQAHQDSAS